MVKTQKPKPPKHWEEVEHPVLSTRGAGRVDENAHVETLIDALGKSQGFSWFRRTEVMGTLWPIHHLILLIHQQKTGLMGNRTDTLMILNKDGVSN